MYMAPPLGRVCESMVMYAFVWLLYGMGMMWSMP